MGLLDCSIALKQAFKDTSSGIEVRVKTIHVVQCFLAHAKTCSSSPQQHRRTRQNTIGVMYETLPIRSQDRLEKISQPTSDICTGYSKMYAFVLNYHLITAGSDTEPPGM